MSQAKPEPTKPDCAKTTTGKADDEPVDLVPHVSLKMNEEPEVTLLV